MQKFLELIKSGALKKQKIVLSFAGDSAGRSLELKQQMEVEFLTWDSSRSSTLIKKGQ